LIQRTENSEFLKHQKCFVLAPVQGKSNYFELKTKNFFPQAIVHET